MSGKVSALVGFSRCIMDYHLQLGKRKSSVMSAVLIFVGVLTQKSSDRRNRFLHYTTHCTVPTPPNRLPNAQVSVRIIPNPHPVRHTEYVGEKLSI